MDSSIKNFVFSLHANIFILLERFNIPFSKQNAEILGCAITSLGVLFYGLGKNMKEKEIDEKLLLILKYAAKEFDSKQDPVEIWAGLKESCGVEQKPVIDKDLN